MQVAQILKPRPLTILARVAKDYHNRCTTKCNGAHQVVADMASSWQRQPVVSDDASMGDSSRCEHDAWIRLAESQTVIVLAHMVAACCNMQNEVNEASANQLIEMPSCWFPSTLPFPLPCPRLPEGEGGPFPRPLASKARPPNRPFPNGRPFPNARPLPPLPRAWTTV